MCCKNPNDTDAGDISDWGSGTHTFNEHFDYGKQADVTRSARTLCWNKSNSKTFKSVYDYAFDFVITHTLQCQDVKSCSSSHSGLQRRNLSGPSWSSGAEKSSSAHV